VQTDLVETIVHRDLGRIDVDAQVLYGDTRTQALVVLTTRPDSESHSKLELLRHRVAATHL